MITTREFLEILIQYPDLPIVPVVESEVVPNDSYDKRLGSIKKIEVTEYITLKEWNDDRLFLRENQKEIEKLIRGELVFKKNLGLIKMTEGEMDSLAHEKSEALPWKKAIIVWVGKIQA